MRRIVPRRRRKRQRHQETHRWAWQYEWDGMAHRRVDSKKTSPKCWVDEGRSQMPLGQCIYVSDSSTTSQTRPKAPAAYGPVRVPADLFVRPPPTTAARSDYAAGISRQVRELGRDFSLLRSSGLTNYSRDRSFRRFTPHTSLRPVGGPFDFHANTTNLA
jgi:hypothetical protein